MRGKMLSSMVVVLAVFALPVLADSSTGGQLVKVSVASAPQERSVRGVVEAIDAIGQRIRLSGTDYSFSPATVRIASKSGKLPSSSLHVGDRVQCVVVADGAKLDVTEMWVQT
jgi:hypothetical protein